LKNHLTKNNEHQNQPELKKSSKSKNPLNSLSQHEKLEDEFFFPQNSNWAEYDRSSRTNKLYHMKPLAAPRGEQNFDPK